MVLDWLFLDWLLVGILDGTDLLILLSGLGTGSWKMMLDVLLVA